MSADSAYGIINIDLQNHTTPEIIKSNVDVEATVKLNLAAGNFIDHHLDAEDPRRASHVYEGNLKRQVGIDLSECFELLEAYVVGDTSLLRDALADKRITLNGFQPILPFSLIGDYRDAVANNFTRFDSTYERALETQEKYKALDVPTDITLVSLGDGDTVTEYFVNKVAEDCTANNGESFSRGKWVKSKYFTNDAFETIEGLFANASDANEITKRYTHTRQLIRKLTHQINHAYVAKIKTLED